MECVTLGCGLVLRSCVVPCLALPTARAIATDPAAAPATASLAKRHASKRLAAAAAAAVLGRGHAATTGGWRGRRKPTLSSFTVSPDALWCLMCDSDPDAVVWVWRLLSFASRRLPASTCDTGTSTGPAGHPALLLHYHEADTGGAWWC